MLSCKAATTQTGPVREPASVCGLPNREDLVSCILGVPTAADQRIQQVAMPKMRNRGCIIEISPDYLWLLKSTSAQPPTWKINTAQYQHDTVTGGIRLVGTGQLIGPNLESQTAKQPATAESNAGSTLHELRQQTHLGLKMAERH